MNACALCGTFHRKPCHLAAVRLTASGELWALTGFAADGRRKRRARYRRGREGVRPRHRGRR